MTVGWCGACRGVHEIPGPCTFLMQQTGNPCCTHCEIHTELMREVVTVLREIHEYLQRPVVAQ